MRPSQKIKDQQLVTNKIGTHALITKTYIINAKKLQNTDLIDDLL